MFGNVKISTLAEKTKEGKGKLFKIINYGNGNKKVRIPINRDGTVKWFNDEKLRKKE